MLYSTKRLIENAQSRSDAEKNRIPKQHSFSTNQKNERDREQNISDDKRRRLLNNNKDENIFSLPVWMQKLHGLSVEYKCEICGNQSYWGKRNFEKHFQEGRHAANMRLLGIPNTFHFQNVVKIEDALAIYTKLKDKL